jgi:hypothetical protein
MPQPSLIIISQATATATHDCALSVPACLLPHRYGKKFDELSTNEQRAVGGVKGGAARGGHSADPDPDRAPPQPDVKFGEDNE